MSYFLLSQYKRICTDSEENKCDKNKAYTELLTLQVCREYSSVVVTAARSILTVFGARDTANTGFYRSFYGNK
jgi:hypothetical protein